MKYLIHKYLSFKYVIQEDNIYYYDQRVYSSDLWEELGLIFDISEIELKMLISDWCKKQSDTFDFDKFWATKKKILASWNAEQVQDLAGYYSIDAAAMLSSLLAAEIEHEIINNIMTDYETLNP